MKKEKQYIEYGILWYIDNLITEVIEKKELEKLLESHLKGLDVIFENLKVREEMLYIRFLAKHPIQLSKINIFLQKQLKIAYPSLVVKQFTGITRTGQVAIKDSRIQNMMQVTDEIAYYDLDEVCEEENTFKAYIGNRPLTIIECDKKTFLVDEEALAIPIYLNCFECTKIYQYGCCCGSPCDMSEKNKKLFRQHEKEIELAMKSINHTDYEAVLKQGGFMKHDGSINEYNGRCAMLVEEEGIYKCMAHKYALDQGVPIYDLCPLSCLMYPLEIIELIANYKTKAILLTSAVEETFAKDFSRWGSYKKLDVDLRCLNQKAHDEKFQKEKYKPVYEVNEGLLRHEFGNTFYKALKEVLTQ